MFKIKVGYCRENFLQGNFETTGIIIDIFKQTTTYENSLKEYLGPRWLTDKEEKK